MKNEIQLLPQVQKALDQIDKFIIELGSENSIEAYRKLYERMDVIGGVSEKLARVEDKFIPGNGGPIPIRIYRPSLRENLPVLLYFHGGSFYMGGLNSHDTLLRALTKAAHCTVISVAYRLAPEFPFPAALEDCYTATKWVSTHAEEIGVDADCIAVAGDSAGGALATVVARRATESSGGPRIIFQGLFCPVTDASLNTDSWKKFSEGPVLRLADADQWWSYYVPDHSERINPDVSPIYAHNLSNMPPALIITAQYDPLRDEAVKYAHALKNAGIIVKHSDYKEMIHGFYQMGGIISNGKNAISEMAESLNQYF